MRLEPRPMLAHAMNVVIHSGRRKHVPTDAWTTMHQVRRHTKEGPPHLKRLVQMREAFQAHVCVGPLDDCALWIKTAAA